MTRLRQRLKGGEVAFGTWATIASTDTVDMLRGLGLDWIVMDTEHAPITVERASQMIQVLNGSEVTPLIRVGQLGQAIQKISLDIGAQGLVIPLVNSRAEAEGAVSFSKYPPMGVRGAAGGKASRFGQDLARYLRSANDETTVIVQIETPQAVDNIKEIVAVKGVDVAFVGPTDLTMTLGLIDDRTNPRVVEAMLKVVKACEDAGKVAGIMTANTDEAKLAVERGFKFISLGSDMRYLTNGAKAFLGAVGKA